MGRNEASYPLPHGWLRGGAAQLLPCCAGVPRYGGGGGRRRRWSYRDRGSQGDRDL